jgi:uncharacterized protein
VGGVTLIVKATRLCNLRCTYCHDWESGPNQTMSFEVLARTISAAMRDPSHDVVTFVWHGGETTLLPIDFYRRAMAVQSRFRRQGQVVRNQLQTNATRLTPEWVTFFRDNGFHIGVSLDGPAEVQNSYRVDAKGKPTFDRVVSGLRLLEQHQVQFGVLMVVDETTIASGADALFDFILELGLRRLGLLAVTPTNQPEVAWPASTPHYTSPATMGRFLSDLYDRWFDHGDSDIRIREFDEIEHAIGHRQRGGGCKTAGQCIGNYFIVEPNGDVGHCDLFRGDDNYYFGNVTVDDFVTFRVGEKAQRLIRERAADVAKMTSCPDFDLCQGWCPHEAYLSRRHNPDHVESCCGLHTFIDHVRSRRAGQPTEAREVRESRLHSGGGSVVRLPMPKLAVAASD